MYLDFATFSDTLLILSHSFILQILRLLKNLNLCRSLFLLKPLKTPEVPANVGIVWKFVPERKGDCTLCVTVEQLFCYQIRL